jgi:streptomycin 6-kinase
MGLIECSAFSYLSYNFVAFASRGEEQVVLKLGTPNDERRSEIAALRLFDGKGACRLIDYDEEKWWMLLERLKPGAMLVTLEDDAAATHIAAEVMKKIWRPLKSLESASLPAKLHEQALALQDFIQLSD